MAWICEIGRPHGVGIDCPLWWSSGQGGGRKADQWIRKEGRISSGTVQSANSLQGAVLVQGMMLAMMLRERYPGVPITEAHPKALLHFLGLNQSKWDEVRKHFNPLEGDAPSSEHERDALLAAVAIRQGMTGVWSRDLSVDRCASELDPKRIWFGEVSYFWPPKPRPSAG